MDYITDTTTQSYNPGFPRAWEGLDYESAKEATPRWYGVSTGNGNNGVSHTWPDYYVRTAYPFQVAAAAMLGQFNEGEGQTWAVENCEIDGEREYTISACIYSPPEEPSDRDHSECEDGEDCEGCDQCEPDTDMDYCFANGAWMIVEVFSIGDMGEERSNAMHYESDSDAFSADLWALAEPLA